MPGRLNLSQPMVSLSSSASLSRNFPLESRMNERPIERFPGGVKGA